MKILVAGATGAVGKRLVPMLAGRGHEVFGTTRSEARFAELRALGAEPIALDALNRDAVMAAVEAARPEVVVHQLTALSRAADLRHMDRYLAETNRLRTEGTDHLLAAAIASGARRFVAQGFIGWSNPRTGGWVKTEEDPLDSHPTAETRESVAAMRHVEETVTQAKDIAGIVVRYGWFYGPGTSIGPGGEIPAMINKGRLPVVGGGAGVWSFVHIDDAAQATVIAIESNATGLFNIVDDDPAPVHQWLPYLAGTIGAKPPMRVPAWLARLMIGETGVSIMTLTRGSANAKAKRVLNFKPEYASWREGFRTLNA